uniref:F-BAR domain only protein 2 n=1 Tax=Cacopsylla melanoneura TaxID=428564 RepID=A0A8D8WS06_9HEMI
MNVDFSDYFWGDKNTGFDVLYHNMKHGLLASKELSDFFRERANIEENNSKLFGKLAKQSGGSGTFSPLWHVLRKSIENIAATHLNLMHKVNDLVKDICKYTEEMQKKHKLVKEEQGPTLEIVQTIQSTTLVLQKAKDVYQQKCEELDKLKRDNASAKDLEKAEIKVKKAQEDFKTIMDKYSLVKEDFEKRMSISCKYFQQVEEAHLKQMKEFLNSYTEVIEKNHEQIGKYYLEFKRQCLELTIDNLLEQFVRSKYTGLEKPVLSREDLIPPLPLVNLNPTEPVAEVKPSMSVETKPPKREGSNKEAVLSPQGFSGVGQGMPTSAPSSPNNSPLAAPVITLSRNPLRNSKCKVQQLYPSLFECIRLYCSHAKSWFQIYFVSRNS